MFSLAFALEMLVRGMVRLLDRNRDRLVARGPVDVVTQNLTTNCPDWVSRWSFKRARRRIQRHASLQAAGDGIGNRMRLRHGHRRCQPRPVAASQPNSCRPGSFSSFTVKVTV